MNVRHAQLLDVVGRPAKFGGVTFVPANLELAGDVFTSAFALGKLPREELPPVLWTPIDEGFDVAWVRARLPVVFAFTPQPSEVEKSVLTQGFVAVPAGGHEGIAFVCSDYYGRTALTFSPDETDERLAAKVADAFWGLLLADAEAVADFVTDAYHDGAGIWMHFGCRDGELFYSESEDREG